MRSSIAHVEPLPLVPPMVTTGTDPLPGLPPRGREKLFPWDRVSILAATSRTRSRPNAMAAGCCAEMYASQSSSEVFLKRGFAGSSFGDGLSLEERDEARDLLAQVAPVHDHVDGALLQQEFRALETFGQRLAHRLLDDARAGEAD